jgi:hypothetical protein
MIHELHRSLPSETVYFGCSATLDLEIENAFKKFGGFREEGSQDNAFTKTGFCN